MVLYGGVEMHVLLIVAETIVAVVLITVVLMQPSKTNGMSGLITGGSVDTFYSKNKSKTEAALLSRITVICAILFAVLALAQNLF